VDGAYSPWRFRGRLKKSEQALLPYIISGTNSVGALSLKRDSAGGGHQKGAGARC